MPPTFAHRGVSFLFPACAVHYKKAEDRQPGHRSQVRRRTPPTSLHREAGSTYVDESRRLCTATVSETPDGRETSGTTSTGWLAEAAVGRSVGRSVIQTKGEPQLMRGRPGGEDRVS